METGGSEAIDSSRMAIGDSDAPGLIRMARTGSWTGPPGALPSAKLASF